MSLFVTYFYILEYIFKMNGSNTTILLDLEEILVYSICWIG